ncbi:MAG: DUF2849 domain-containing protein [Parerythrobacter sp.]
MKILTGNDLKSGAVVWWDGKGWVADVAASADVGEDGEAIMAREEAARRVNVPYIIAAAPDADGTPRPAHVKDRIRGLGPTVRPDLTLKPDDPAAVREVI